ncbi:MAG: hypothetical protein BMS9Abin34_293 [Patescibacteria group bacterium]|nr:MAG: hypothetical protein BMS9Abin34_293 [Patescibacteria group bacterium]
MFKEPSASAKDEALLKIRDSVWVFFAEFFELDEGLLLKDRETIGYLLWTLNPEFAEKLMEGASDWQDELQKLFNQSIGLFAQCLSRTIEVSFLGKPVNREMLEELISILEGICGALGEWQTAYLQSLDAEGGEQALPPFLQRAVNLVPRLLEEYVLEFAERMEPPEDDFVQGLFARCTSPGVAQGLAQAIEKVSRLATDILESGVASKEAFFEALIERLDSFLGPES